VVLEIFLFSYIASEIMQFCTYCHSYNKQKQKRTQKMWKFFHVMLSTTEGKEVLMQVASKRVKIIFYVNILGYSESRYFTVHSFVRKYTLNI
jgi:hypothetical protein